MIISLSDNADNSKSVSQFSTEVQCTLIFHFGKEFRYGLYTILAYSVSLPIKQPFLITFSSRLASISVMAFSHNPHTMQPIIIYLYILKHTL